LGERPAARGGATAGEIALAIARKYRKRVDDESMEKALRRLTRDRLLVRIKGTTYYQVAREPLTDEEVEKLAEVEFQRQIAATGKINVKAAAEKLREMGASLNREDFNRRDSLIKLVTDYRKKSKA
jgi:hypothetical protein